MKQESIRYILALVVFAFCILGLACPAPQDQAVNNANDVAEEAVDDAAVDDGAVGTCDGDIQARVEKVRTHIQKKLAGILQQGVFEVVVEPLGTESISVRFLGRIWGLDGSNTNLKKLTGALKGLAKSKCVTSVTFGPIPTAPVPDGGKTAESLTIPGFEWSLCEAPQQPCPDGTCRSICTLATPPPTPDPATNAN